MKRTLNTTINRSKSERGYEFHSNGPKWFVAHSLGNMLVSAAIQDWQMPCARYFMLNAAVPIEAYDASTNAVNDIDKDRMLPRDWIGYDDALKASHWHELFQSPW